MFFRFGSLIKLTEMELFIKQLCLCRFTIVYLNLESYFFIRVLFITIQVYKSKATNTKKFLKCIPLLIFCFYPIWVINVSIMFWNLCIVVGDHINDINSFYFGQISIDFVYSNNKEALFLFIQIY